MLRFSDISQEYWGSHYQDSLTLFSGLQKLAVCGRDRSRYSLKIQASESTRPQTAILGKMPLLPSTRIDRRCP
jgi:hypothetical protein